MTKVADPTSYWAVLARPRGEVLAAEAESRGLYVGIIGPASTFAAPEMDGWLEEMISVAHEASAVPGRALPIPPLLHHAMTGLLFSHGELWERPPGQGACSFTFIQDGNQIGFGWVGNVAITLTVDGEPHEPRPVTIRDDSGRLGHAWSTSADRTVQVGIAWKLVPDDPASPGAEIEAVWTGAGGPAPAAAPASRSATAQAPTIITEASAPVIPVEPATARRADRRRRGAERRASTPTIPETTAAPARVEPIEVVPLAPAAAGAAAPRSAPETPSAEAVEAASASMLVDDSTQPTAETEEVSAGSTPETEMPGGGSEAAPWWRRFGAWITGKSETSRESASVVVEPEEVPAEVRESAGDWVLVRDESSDSSVELAAEPDETPAISDVIPPTPEPAELTREALGQAAEAVETAPDSVVVEAVAEDSTPPTAEEVSPESTPETETLRSGSEAAPWWRRFFGWNTGKAKASPPSAEPEAIEAEVGESEGDASLVRDESSDSVAGLAAQSQEMPVVPDVIPPTDESATISGAATQVAPDRAPKSPRPPAWRAPDRIPPTPEPAELTRQALGQGDQSDPHLIVLPPEAEESIGSPTSTAEPPALAAPEALAPAAPVFEPPAPPAIAQPLAPRPALEPPEATVTEPATLAASSTTLPAEILEPAAPAFDRSVPARRPAWPSAHQLARRPAPLWRTPWTMAAGVLVLIAGGWLVATFKDSGGAKVAGVKSALNGALQSLGLAGPHFSLSVTSRPAGATILVDGKPVAGRTPTQLSLSPGEHSIRLSYADFGGANFAVRGISGEQVPLDGDLRGTLDIHSPSADAVVSVTVDGQARGLAPLRIQQLAPGAHQVRFSGPSFASWEQKVDLHVGETKNLVARATPSPDTGVLLVEAVANGEQGAMPIEGGQVWIDGELRGTAPLTLDLPRGPHSVRLVQKGREAPVQVIELPGASQRSAVFHLGLDAEGPKLSADVPSIMSPDRPTVVSGALAGGAGLDVREMWLHAQGGDGPWRRYAMTLMRAPDGMVGVAIFPLGSFGDDGTASYYISAIDGQGVESFTEIRTAQLARSSGH